MMISLIPSMVCLAFEHKRRSKCTSDKAQTGVKRFGKPYTCLKDFRIGDKNYTRKRIHNFLFVCFVGNPLKVLSVNSVRFLVTFQKESFLHSLHNQSHPECDFAQYFFLAFASSHSHFGLNPKCVFYADHFALQRAGSSGKIWALILYPLSISMV